MRGSDLTIRRKALIRVEEWNERYLSSEKAYLCLKLNLLMCINTYLPKCDDDQTGLTKNVYTYRNINSGPNATSHMGFFSFILRGYCSVAGSLPMQQPRATNRWVIFPLLYSFIFIPQHYPFLFFSHYPMLASYTFWILPLMAAELPETGEQE